MKASILAAATALLFSSAVQSAAARSDAMPSWVLVIPVRSIGDGSLTVWDRKDAWSSAWRIPAAYEGIQFLAVMGDSEDKKNVPTESLNAPEEGVLSSLADKYKAPAVAIAKVSDDTLSVAVSDGGKMSKWSSVSFDGTNLAEGRRRAGELIASLLEHPVEEEEDGGSLSILAWRVGADGASEYWLETEPGQAESIPQRLSGIAGLTVMSVSEGDESTTIEVSSTEGDIERKIAEAGITLRQKP